jgi:hypothetical protein
MLRDRIDIRRLRADLRALAADCVLLKRTLRARWERPMADEQQRLHRLRRRVTDLLVLLAASRGRRHVTTPPRDGRAPGEPWDAAEHNARIADRVALDYARPAEGEARTP